MSETNPNNIESDKTDTPAEEVDTPAEKADGTVDASDDTKTPNSPGISDLEDKAEADPLGDTSEDSASRIAELEAQVEELNDKLLRALAEAENVRRRAQRDKEDTAKYGIKSFAEGMLAVADNLGRALTSIDADARDANESLGTIFVGIEMVQKDLMSTFERYGVTPIKALGAKFDPMLHEAMFEIEDKNTPISTIAQVLEPGYVLHGRTLRAAKVGITKGGPKETTPAEAPPNHTEAEAPEPAAREGQAAYENHAETKTPAGGTLDQEL